MSNPIKLIAFERQCDHTSTRVRLYYTSTSQLKNNDNSRRFYIDINRVPDTNSQVLDSNSCVPDTNSRVSDSNSHVLDTNSRVPNSNIRVPKIV